MKIHRIREAKSIDGKDRGHLFVEIQPNRWIEVSKIPTHEAIEKYNQLQEDCEKFDLTFNTRAFQIGIIKDWMEHEPITN